MKHLKSFESRYTEKNIDKEWYVWKKPSQFGKGYDVGVINILRVVKKVIYYSTVRRTGGYYDFFNNAKPIDYTINGNKISLAYWKSNMFNNLLFGTDNADDAILFYNLYTNDEITSKDDIDLYIQSNKYNL